MKDRYFKITGTRVTGDYFVKEYINGVPNELFKIVKKYKGGLKEARQRIGEHLKNQGYSMNDVFKHECIVPGRKNNPSHKWTIEEYLIGVPIK
ncbi:hypothetical protein [Paenibacillus periandrae]|uniref:hypothetical protein n=1 Tax=Paenibacillus periandrae TaxID=1761741 RepID=UPI001F09A2B2|nr:hypothetical protein [Paenibacillus periandrae]